MQAGSLFPVCTSGTGAEARDELATGSPARATPDTSPPQLDNTSLTVQHLSPDLDEHSLRRLFEPFGEIVRVGISQSTLARQPSTFGVVQFFDASAATAAAKGLDGLPILGKAIRVSVGGRIARLGGIAPQAGSAPATSRLFLDPDCDDEADSDLSLDPAPLISVQGLSPESLCPSTIVEIIQEASIGNLVECAGVRLLPPIDTDGKHVQASSGRWAGLLRCCLVFALTLDNAPHVHAVAAALRDVLPPDATPK